MKFTHPFFFLTFGLLCVSAMGQQASPSIRKTILQA